MEEPGRLAGDGGKGIVSVAYEEGALRAFRLWIGFYPLQSAIPPTPPLSWRIARGIESVRAGAVGRWRQLGPPRTCTDLCRDRAAHGRAVH
jgi:hypothetical protein